MSVLQRLATGEPASVFPAIGEDSLGAVEDLMLDPGLALAATPRHANVLLVAGKIREEDQPNIRRLHDQMPHPRATVWWDAEPGKDFGQGAIVTRSDDAAGRISGAWRSLVAGELASEPDLLPNEPPAPWRGEGDHGQGGEGMMGGKPYGRPMAMTDDDLRDGLALDSYSAEFGPFLPVLPPGLLLEITLQGDCIQNAQVVRAPYSQKQQPARVAALHSIARMLRLLGLPVLARRFFSAARDISNGAEPDLSSLERRFRWSGALHAIPPGLGAFRGNDVRARLARWVDAARDPEGVSSDGEATSKDRRLADMLTGREWSEACLIVNSFGPRTLATICQPEKNPEAGERE